MCGAAEEDSVPGLVCVADSGKDQGTHYVDDPPNRPRQQEEVNVFGRMRPEEGIEPQSKTKRLIEYVHFRVAKPQGGLHASLGGTCE